MIPMVMNQAEDSRCGEAYYDSVPGVNPTEEKKEAVCITGIKPVAHEAHI